MIRLRLDAGWHWGEPWRLFYVAALEIMRGYIVILDVSVLKFSVSVGIEW